MQTSPFLLVSGWRNPEDTAKAKMAEGPKFRLMGSAAQLSLKVSQVPKYRFRQLTSD